MPLMDRSKANSSNITNFSSTEHLSLSDGEDCVSGDDDTCIASPSAIDVSLQHGESGYIDREESHSRPQRTSWRNRLIFWTTSNTGVYEKVASDSQHQTRHDEFDYRPNTGKLATFTQGLKSLLFSSWLNALIIFVPIGLATYLLRMAPALVFSINAIAIIPLSALLTSATERIAQDAGDTVGALLNITLGNLVELIIFVALQDGHLRVVQASILGSILVNLLLILGSALLAYSMTNVHATYSTSGTQLLGCLLFVSVFAFLMPTTFDYTFKHIDNSEGISLQMSRLSAFLVLAVYLIYVIHELKPKKTSSGTRPRRASDIESRSLQLPTLNRNAISLAMPSRTIRFADESMTLTTTEANDGSKKALGEEDQCIDGNVLAENSGGSRIHDRLSVMGGACHNDHTSDSAYRPFSSQSTRPSRSLSLSSSRGGRLSLDSSFGLEGRRVLMRSALPTIRAIHGNCDDVNLADNDEKPPRNSKMDTLASAMVLAVTSALMSMCAEFLVSTIDEVTHEGHLSESLIGLIILPIVGNMAEYITVVTVAVKEKLDLAIAVSVGSSIQIALCVTPLTVLAGWILNRDLVLTFNFFEMATLIGTVLLVNLIILGDGSGGPRSNALRGGLICGCYAMIGVGAYLSPDS